MRWSALLVAVLLISNSTTDVTAQFVRKTLDDGRKIVFVRPYPIATFSGMIENNTGGVIDSLKVRATFFDPSGNVLVTSGVLPKKGFSKNSPLLADSTTYFHGPFKEIETAEIDTVGIPEYTATASLFLDDELVSEDSGLKITDFTSFILPSYWVDDVPHKEDWELKVTEEEVFRKLADVPQIRIWVLTKEMYDLIQPGMSYTQVLRIVGRPGEETSSTQLGGISSIMYQWTNRDGSNMTALFQNDEMVSKAQFGLK